MFNRKKQRAVVFVLAILISVGLIATSTIYLAAPGGSGPVPGSLEAQMQVVTGNIASYEASLANEPENRGLWVALGNARYDLGILNWQKEEADKAAELFLKAVEAYGKALELDPNDVNVRVDMATAAFYGGDNEVAENNFKQAIEQDSNHLQAHFNYGVFLQFAKMDPIGAIQVWEKALALNPDQAMADQINRNIEQARSQIGQGMGGMGGSMPFSMPEGHP